MNDLMKLFDGNLTCTDIEIQLMLETNSPKGKKFIFGLLSSFSSLD